MAKSGWVVAALVGLVQPVLAQTVAPEPAAQPTLVVAGEVISRQDLWDRRSNSLMGRPDFLKEIVLKVAIARGIAGEVSPNTKTIAVSIRRPGRMTAFKHLAQGWKGHFHLAGATSPYELVDFTEGIAPPERPRPQPAPVAVRPPRARVFPDEYGGREIRDSKLLQERAVREIARRYGMTEASVVTLTSFQGPMPPEGGYVYWGVKGKKHGTWWIWQAGETKPRPGDDLIDPQQYQK